LAQIGTQRVEPESVSSFNINEANQTVTVTFEWLKICEKAGQDPSPDCLKSFSTTLNLGFNKDCQDNNFNDGSIRLNFRYRYIGNSPPQTFGCDGVGGFEAFCFFNAFPGDEKVYITNGSSSLLNSLRAGNQTADILGPVSGTDASSLSYRAVRIFYTQGSSFNAITLNSPSKELPLNASGGLLENRIEGLTNGLPFVFLSASVDEAGNVVLFSDPLVTGSIMNPNPTPTGETQGAIPEKVFGLLEGKSCFVATLAFGSQDAYPVQLLRLFRDQVLHSSQLGKVFVSFYYRYSPHWVTALEQRPVLVGFIKISLMPLVGLLVVTDWIAFKTGIVFGQAFFVSSFLMMICFFAVFLVFKPSFLRLKASSKAPHSLRPQEKKGEA
jgi:hypothetical protein